LEKFSIFSKKIGKKIIGLKLPASPKTNSGLVFRKISKIFDLDFFINKPK